MFGKFRSTRKSKATVAPTIGAIDLKAQVDLSERLLKNLCAVRAAWLALPFTASSLEELAEAADSIHLPEWTDESPTVEQLEELAKAAEKVGLPEWTDESPTVEQLEELAKAAEKVGLPEWTDESPTVEQLEELAEAASGVAMPDLNG